VKSLHPAKQEIRNTYDLDMVDQLFLKDGRVTYFSSEKEGLIRGIEAVREHHRGFGFVPGGKKPPSELRIEDEIAGDLGDTAIVTAIWFFGDRQKTENQHRPMTAVYVRAGDGFRLAHLNFSHY
jgi:SnoaL-like domain